MNFRMGRIILRLMRGIGALIIAIVAFLALIALLVVIQGQREETRQAGAAIILDGSSHASDQLERALNLHRRGIIRRIYLLGPHDISTGQAYLLERGVPAETIVQLESTPERYEQLRATSSAAYTDGVSSFLLVGEPWEMLRALKMAQDLDMLIYASPTTRVMSGNDFMAILSESGAYLRYIFFGY